MVMSFGRCKTLRSQQLKLVSFEDLIQIDFEDGLRYLLWVLKWNGKYHRVLRGIWPENMDHIIWTIFWRNYRISRFNLLRPAEDLLLLNIFDFSVNWPSGTFYKNSEVIRTSWRVCRILIWNVACQKLSRIQIQEMETSLYYLFMLSYVWKWKFISSLGIEK